MEYLDDNGKRVRMPKPIKSDTDETEFIDESLQAPAPVPQQQPVTPPTRPSFFRKPIISLPKRGKDIRDYVEENKHKPSVTQMLNELLDERKYGEMKQDTQRRSRPWKWPYSWKSKIKKASKFKELVLVFYFTIKGELETFIVPIYGGNMVIIKNKVYEFDPRAVWTTKIGFKWYKLLAIKEIDRRPISNLDLDEIRKRGDSTDSDEFLIKAALKAQVQTAAKAVNRGLIILIAILVIGALLFFFFSRG